jgi:hypothetical protein
MSIHNIISHKITDLLENIYYNNLQKLYNINILQIFNISNFTVIKPYYFVYLQYYLIYLFFHYITFKNTIKYTLSLHMYYICDNIYDNLVIKYNYTSIHNIKYLKNISKFLFLYLLFFKILFLKIWIFKQLFLISVLSLFYLLTNINELYKERLQSIELKKDFNHPLKILIITPNINTIKYIINKTNIFTFTNFLFLTNILVYLFI